MHYPLQTVFALTAKGLRDAGGTLLPKDIRRVISAIDGKSTVSELIYKSGVRSDYIPVLLEQLLKECYVEICGGPDFNHSRESAPTSETTLASLKGLSPALTQHASATQLMTTTELVLRSRKSVADDTLPGNVSDVKELGALDPLGCAPTARAEPSVGLAVMEAPVDLRAPSQGGTSTESNCGTASSIAADLPALRVAESNARQALEAQMKAVSDVLALAAQETQARNALESRMKALDEALTLARQQANEETARHQRLRSESQARAEADKATREAVEQRLSTVEQALAQAQAAAQAEAQARADFEQRVVAEQAERLAIEGKLRAMTDVLAHAQKMAAVETKVHEELEAELQATIDSEREASKQAELRAQSVETALTEARVQGEALQRLHADAEARVDAASLALVNAQTQVAQESALRNALELKLHAHDQARQQARDALQRRAQVADAAFLEAGALTHALTSALADVEATAREETDQRAQMRSLAGEIGAARDAARGESVAKLKNLAQVLAQAQQLALTETQQLEQFDAEMQPHLAALNGAREGVVARADAAAKALAQARALADNTMHAIAQLQNAANIEPEIDTLARVVESDQKVMHSASEAKLEALSRALTAEQARVGEEIANRERIESEACHAIDAHREAREEAERRALAAESAARLARRQVEETLDARERFEDELRHQLDVQAAARVTQAVSATQEANLRMLAQARAQWETEWAARWDDERARHVDEVQRLREASAAHQVFANDLQAQMREIRATADTQIDALRGQAQRVEAHAQTRLQEARARDIEQLKVERRARIEAQALLAQEREARQAQMMAARGVSNKKMLIGAVGLAVTGAIAGKYLPLPWPGAGHVPAAEQKESVGAQPGPVVNSQSVTMDSLCLPQALLPVSSLHAAVLVDGSPVEASGPLAGPAEGVEWGLDHPGGIGQCKS